MTSDPERRHSHAGGRSEEISALVRSWRRAVRARMHARPIPEALDSGIGSSSLVYLVGWILDAAAEDLDLPSTAAEALGEFVLGRRREGQLLEEVLIELRALEDLLLRRLEAEAGEAPAGQLARARGVAERMSVVMTVAAGMYNEEVEQERRAERRKLDDFTRMVSHEMRTPIGAAYTAARLLREMGSELPDEERARMLDVVARGLSRATHLLESVMSIALARTGDDGTLRTRSLRELVEDTVADVTLLAEQEGVRVEVAGTVPSVQVDARRVELLLHNLLSNAVKYADDSKADRWVRVRVERDRESYGWRVEVADNGTGIRRDDQEKIFRRFFRAHTDLAEGTGLGLVIAREAAEQLGGDITLESVPGVGSTFAFVVPEASAGEPGSAA